MDGMVRPERLATDAADADEAVPEAEVLRRFIEAIESGELMESAPQDVAVVRRLQGTLSALESVTAGAHRES
jgi:hypothetical protein